MDFYKKYYEDWETSKYMESVYEKNIPVGYIWEALKVLDKMDEKHYTHVSLTEFFSIPKCI